MSTMKQLNYRKKNKLLLAGGILLLFVLYKISWKKTIAAYGLNKTIGEQMAQASNAPQKLALLEQQNLECDRILGTYQNTESNTQQLLLSAVSGYCQQTGLLLKEFPKSIFKQENEYMVETNYFVLEGPFSTILRLTHQLEQKNRIGKIVSVNYLVKKDNKTQKNLLDATIYIQNVKKNSDED
jgi:hypothetical protein